MFSFPFITKKRYNETVDYYERVVKKLTWQLADAQNWKSTGYETIQTEYYLKPSNCSSVRKITKPKTKKATTKKKSRSN